MRTLILFLIISNSVLSQTSASCFIKTLTCLDCLSCGSYVWTHIGCKDSCDMIVDTRCYSLSTFPYMAAVQICSVADNDAVDNDLCYSQMDCSLCVGTVLSNGVSTCQWFKETATCTPRCNALGGCGETTCP